MVGQILNLRTLIQFRVL